jgi:hypothetical protein
MGRRMDMSKYEYRHTVLRSNERGCHMQVGCIEIFANNRRQVASKRDVGVAR